MPRRLVVILAIGIVLFAWMALDGPGARQRRGMKAAHEMAERLKPVLASDARFATVELRVSTVPSLLVHGEVADQSALDDLKKLIVLPANAEFGLTWLVKIKESGATPSRQANQ
jgi:hypothetical protein